MRSNLIRSVAFIMGILSFALFLNACEKADYQHPLYRNSQKNK